jgi:ammonia channel protein AmtB
MYLAQIGNSRLRNSIGTLVQILLGILITFLTFFFFGNRLFLMGNGGLIGEDEYLGSSITKNESELSL